MKYLPCISFALLSLALPATAMWRMQAIFGSASVERAQIRQGQILKMGSSIKTGANGTVFGLFEPMGVQTLTTPFAELTLSAYTQSKKGGRASVWYVGKGVTDFKVPRLLGCDYQQINRGRGCNSSIRVISRYGVTDIKGTRLSFRSDDTKGTVGVSEGAVITSNAGISRTVEAGRYVLLRVGQPPSAPIEADWDLELKIDPMYQGNGKWKAFVASGNFIIKDGQSVDQTVLVASGDQVRVQNPLGRYVDYKIR